MPIDVLVDTEKWKAGRYQIIFWVLMVLGLLAGLIFLGRSLTPEGNKVLTWPEWQICLAQKAYQKELGMLQKDVEVLVEIVNQPPDPVRAQIVCDKISEQLIEGQPALAMSRTALAQAAVSVEQWSVGAISRGEALTALQAAIYSIDSARAGEAESN